MFIGNMNTFENIQHTGKGKHIVRLVRLEYFNTVIWQCVNLTLV